MYEKLRLKVPIGCDRVYIGRISADGTRFIGDKKDVTADFYKAIIDIWGGYTGLIEENDGTKYRILVEKIS